MFFFMGTLNMTTFTKLLMLYAHNGSLNLSLTYLTLMIQEKRDPRVVTVWGTLELVLISCCYSSVAARMKTFWSGHFNRTNSHELLKKSKIK